MADFYSGAPGGGDTNGAARSLSDVSRDELLTAMPARPVRPSWMKTRFPVPMPEYRRLVEEAQHADTGPTAAVAIAEGVRRVTNRRRSRPLFLTVAAGVILGALPVILFQVLRGDLFGILFQVIYLILATPVVYTRLSGIQLFR